ncbi:excinuclease ABC subunit UvrC [bacterium]|nr:MAG: excinuclease ABC subunit UvrC [bacterium]
MILDRPPLEQTLTQLPDAPGVYLMEDAAGHILYIGKAVSLRSRVRSYFQESSAHHPRTQAMVERVVHARWIVVHNEVEALILEANLIKRHQPPFNVRLRDDKRYPYLKLTNEPFPRLVFTRQVRNDGARYFGPYTDAHGLRELIDLARVVFPMRTCREPIDGRRKRPCLQYYIKRCMAPCVGYQSEDEYDALVDEVVLFLEGKHELLLERLRAAMDAAAEALQYERAAHLRDRLISIRRLTEKQMVVWQTRVDMDLIAHAQAQGQTCFQVFMVRSGKLIGQEHFIVEGDGDAESVEALYSTFLEQFYTARTPLAETPASAYLPKGSTSALDNQAPVPAPERSRKRRSDAAAAIPKEILVQALPEDGGVIERWLSQSKGQRVRILHPQRGARAEYLRMVAQNAEQNLHAFLAHQEVQETASARSLNELAAALDLPEAPRRIECYDISNVQGTNAVASMVVFSDGRAKKSEYRKFAMRYDRGPNDFAMMQEALRRRLRYLRPESVGQGGGVARELAKRDRFSKRPDLLLIDGGKGQLGAVVEVLEELDLFSIPVAGLAKEHEWLYVPGQSEPIVLPPGSPALHLVMRVRDEAHRFAITFHRQRRGKAMTASVLDTVEGVGAVRKRRLFKQFGSITGIKRAALDEIAAVKGFTPQLAARIKEALG